MPTAIAGLGEAGPGRPAPVVSPLIEFGSALHVLRDPGHHGASGWAAAVLAGMTERLAAWTRAWWWTAQAIRAAPFITAAPPAGDFGTVREAVLGELARHEGRAWTGAGQIQALAPGIGGLAQKVWTVPGQPAFWHAAIHLDRLPLASRRATPESGSPVMRTRIVTGPRFAAETTALLARLGPAAPISDYSTLLAARAEPADPVLAGHPAPEVHIADFYLPARHGPVGARWYRHHAAAGPGPVLLWLHGGGFIGGAAADIDHVCSWLAHRAGLTVVSLDDRLAPEHPYPAALLDTCDARRWLPEHGTAIGGDGRVAAGGQSAGAALVAGACLLARDHHLPGAACQVLCYPVVDFGQDTESARLFDGVFHSIKADGWAENHYLAGQPITAHAAPLRAASLAGLPPALVIGAGRDPLRDDARAYAARMDADGVDVSHVEYDATMHAFLNFCGVLSAGDHAIELIAAKLADTC